MKILFVCKYNRFRSKIAEAFFKKINKNKKHSAISAGIFKGNPISKNVKKTAKALRLTLSTNPQGISSKILSKMDLIVIVANNVPKNIFNNRPKNQKVIVWKIKDTQEDNIKNILKISKDIEKRVLKLTGDIK